MATVTKLKAAVNNTNLPILGNDGNLYNYYVGRFFSKLSEYGVSPTSEEISALNDFIESGISSGWIDYVKYFMPFIGSSANALSGLCPLIDRINDYNLSVDNVNANVFDYDTNGRIVSFGHPDCPRVAVTVPFKSSAMGSGFSLFINKTFKSSEASVITTTNTPTIVNSLVTSTNKQRTAFRFSKTTNDNSIYIQNVYRQTESQESLTAEAIGNSTMFVNEQMGLFYARYLNINNEWKFKKYIIFKGSTTPVDSKMSGGYSTNPIFVENSDFTLGADVSNSGQASINCLAVFDIAVTENIISAFNQDVFALTTALGR